MRRFRQKSVIENSGSFSQPAFAELAAVVIAKSGSFQFRARGASMHPYIQDGDVITLSAVKTARGIRVGNIAALVHPESGKLIVHRVIRKTGNEIQTKGDNSKIADAPVSVNAVVGIVSCVTRGFSNTLVGTGIRDLLASLLSRLGLIPSRLSFFLTGKPLP